MTWWADLLAAVGWRRRGKVRALAAIVRGRSVLRAGLVQVRPPPAPPPFRSWLTLRLGPLARRFRQRRG